MDETGAGLLDVAVDIGGTFTDLVAFDPKGARILQAKSLTTHHELSQGVWDCLRKAGVAPTQIASLVHGSTIAINLAIEEKGAKTALIVTKGTRDVYKIGRQNRIEAYNFFFRRPVPLCARELIFEVDERLLASGEAVRSLDPAEAAQVAVLARASGAQAIAVCFLHSYANPGHEKIMGEALRAAAPHLYVSLSHEIVREYREYERTSTTVMNAYIGPRTRSYIGEIEQRLAAEGFAGRFSIMQSNGGVMAPETAKTLPVAMMESGPVGGVIAAAEVGARLGLRDVIAFDMGGTTAKTSLIKDGEVSVAQGYHIGGAASGHPVMFPVVDIIEVGAGGGSIAWIDSFGALKLGPRSAGSDPGPIAYGAGGREPTVTDANVVLGRIGATSFLGGEMRLDADGARRGLAERLSPALGMNEIEAAHGVIAIAVAKMSLAVRGVSVERGYDPRDFALVAMGGAGPLHAVEIARELHIPTVLIPNLPAHFSALGMLMTDVRHDYVRTYYKRLLECDFRALEAIYSELEESGRVVLERAGVDASAQSFHWSMDLRYYGQEFAIQTPVETNDIGRADEAAIRARFNAIHERRYGHAAHDEPIELVNLRLTARGARPKIAFPKRTQSAAAAQSGTRPIYLADPRAPAACAIYQRDLLPSGARARGPCVIEEYGSTTVLFEQDSFVVTDTGEIVIEVGQA